MRAIVDIETDGLLQQVSKVHCAIIQSIDCTYSELFIFTTTTRITEFLDKISQLTDIVLHNGFAYDLLVLKKLLNWSPSKEQKIHDTYILSQLLYPDLFDADDNNTVGSDGHVFSKRDYGSHGLKAWGQRIRTFKGDYDGGWEKYNDEMGKYCIQDGITTKALFVFLESRVPVALTDRRPIELEYSIAPIIARQMAYGVLFDKSKAEELISTLTARMVELKWALQELFPPRQINVGLFIPKINNVAKGYVKDVPIMKTKMEEFNPGSRQQIVSRLKEKWGWDPEEFTEKGNARMDEEIIENLPFTELKPLKEYLTIKKRLSQIESGKQGWLKKIDADGRIRGAIKQNGAVTGRMAHFSPNMAQIPANGSLFGRECRGLFIVPEDKVMVGCDADALEMRCLAGYLSKLDGGKLQRSLLSGKKEDRTDPHSINMYAMKLDGLENGRDAAKTVFYGYVYGAKNAKLGKILMEYGVDFEEYVGDFEKEVKGMMTWAAKKGIEKTEAYWRCWMAGKRLLENFGSGSEELPELKKKIHALVLENGYIKGLDGRKLHCRSEHGELNTLLQSAGAVIMKKALYICDQDLQEVGLVPGQDYEFILNVHDELQIEVKKDDKVIDMVKQITENSIAKAGEYFKFPCPMKGTAKSGNDWSQTH